MRRLLAIVPQHIPYPEHQQLAEEAAFIPLGTSTAAAIIVCCVYFIFLCFSIFNYIYTKYPFYEVLIVSNAFRTAAFGVRAACTVRYRPALTGTWLAFSNAGFGANIATLCIALGTWLNKVGHLYFGKRERLFYTAWAYLLVVAIVLFGAACGVVVSRACPRPICGVIAAGLEYGDYCCRGSVNGERLRFAAAFGLESCVFALMVLSLRLSFTVLITQRNKSGKAAAAEDHSQRQPRLVIMFLVCAMFLAIRGATGATALYLPYGQYWEEDRLFYPLDTLPEFIALVILSWPAFLARMAQSYPKALQDQGKKQGKEQDGLQADIQQGSNSQPGGGVADGHCTNGEQAVGALTNGQHVKDAS